MRLLHARGLPWLVAALAAFTALGVLVGPGPQTATAGTVPNFLRGSAGRHYRIVAAPIRNYGWGWQAIRDSQHRPTGISSISTNGTSINVHYSFRATRVVSFVVTPDESLVTKGIDGGASVNLRQASIVLAKDDERVDPRTVDKWRYPNSDLWIYGVFETD